MVFRKPIDEMTLAGWMAFTLVFMLLMFSRDFGLVYIAMVVAWFIFYVKDKFSYDKKISFPVERTAKGRIESLFVVVIVYGIFLLVTTIITTVLDPQALPSGSMLDVIKLMGAGMVQASAPILRDSRLLMVFGWALLIPITETVLFNGKVFEELHDKLKRAGLKLTKWNINMILLLAAIGGISALYHLTSKSGESTSIIITFIFFTVSGYLVVWRGQLREAIGIHVVGNFLAVASQIGIL